jgi:hypothetical protein
MKTMKKLILLGLFLCAVMSAPAVANINLPPGQDNTYQEWTFSTNPNSELRWTQATDIVADAGYTSPGTPTADVALTGPIMPLPGWYAGNPTSAHTGLIHGATITMDLDIPNIVKPYWWEKTIQVEVIYYVQQYEEDVHGYIDAASYVTAGGKTYESVSVNDTALQGGWRDVTIEWRIPQIFPVELVHLYLVDSGAYVDSVVVATVCRVPEPATLLLLGGAGLVGWLRRRRTM